MKPRDISGRILRRPLSSPFVPRSFRPRLGWVLLGLIAWGLWVTVISDRSLWRIAQLRREIHAAEQELQQVQGEQKALDSQLADPKARSLYTEQILREQHGMARAGEILYRFRDDPVAPDSSRR